MSPDAPKTADSSDDADFAELIDQITNRLQAGEHVDDDALLVQYPRYEDQLRQLLPALRLMAVDLGESRRDLTELRHMRVPTRDADLALQVLGDYQIRRELGRGGMGVVYEADQISLGKRVALKVLPLAAVLDHRSSQRFQNEARAAAQLQHPNIVSVYAVGCEQGVHYYAMQFIDGSDLDEIIGDLRQASEPEIKPRVAVDVLAQDGLDGETRRTGFGSTATLNSSDLFGINKSTGTGASPKYFDTFVRLAMQAAEALEHAHATGIVHRDIKPSNLLVDSGGNLLVTDFGLAQVQGISGLTITGDLVGTLRYMSPEQAYAKRVVVDHRTDIYSLGVTLYEVLTLRRAFEAESKVELLAKIAFEDPCRPRKLNGGIPVELETIVMKAIAKNPDQRYQSAADMADDLRRFQNDEPIAARPPSPIQRLETWIQRRKPLVIAGAVALSAVFIATLSLAFTLYSALQDETEQREEYQRLWKRSEGLRAAANASLQLETDPGLALRLAVIGGDLHPSSEANNVLLEALDANHEQRTLQGHSSPVGTARFDERGTKVVTTATTSWYFREPEAARIWNADDGKFITLEEGTSITSAAFSPRGGRLLTASSPGRRRATDDMPGRTKGRPPAIWDALTGDKLHELTNAFLFDAHPSAFSPSSRRIVTPALGSIAQVWDVLDGIPQYRLEGHAKRVTFAGYGPRGEQIVTISDDNTVRIWDATNGQLVRNFAEWQSTETQPGVPVVASAVLSPDGNRLITNTKDFHVQLWDIESGERINQDTWNGVGAIFGTQGDKIAYELAGRTNVRETFTGELLYQLPGRLQGFSPDGRLVATTSDNVIQLWHAETGRLQAALKGHARTVTTATFSPDSRRIVSASVDRTTRIWNVDSGAERLHFDMRIQRADQTIIAPSPAGTKLLIAGTPEHHSEVWDLEGLKRLVEVPGRRSGPVPVAPRVMTATFDRVTTWNSRNGEAVGSFQSNVGEFRDTLLSADGKVALLIVREGPTWLWNVETGRRVVLAGPTEPVHAGAFRPGGRHVALASADGNALIHDVRTGQPYKSLDHAGRLISIRYSPDGGRMIAVNDQNTANIWNADTGEQVAQLAAEGATFDHVEFTADGRRIVAFRETGSQSVFCFDAETGALTRQLDNVQGVVRVAIHPSDPIVAVASDQTGALLWNLDTGESQSLSTTAMTRCTFSADGKSVVTATDSQRDSPHVMAREESARFVRPMLQIWNVDDGELVASIPQIDGFVQSLEVQKATGHLYVSLARYGATLYDMETHARVGSIDGGGAPLSFAAFTRDGGRIVTASWDQTAAVWDALSGKLLHRLVDHQAAISAAAISHDDGVLATGDAAGAVMLWDLNKGQRHPREVARCNDLVVSCQFDKQGRRLLTNAVDGSLRIVDLETNEELTITGAARSARFSPDGKGLLVVPGGGGFRGLTANGTRQQVARTDETVETNHAVKFYRTVDEPAELLPHDGFPIMATFSGQGDAILTATTHEALLWNAATGESSEMLALSALTVHSISFSPDGKRAILHGPDKILVWDLAANSEVMTLRSHRGFASTPAPQFSPDGKWIIAVVNRRVRLYPTDPLSQGRLRAPRELTAEERTRFKLPAGEQLER